MEKTEVIAELFKTQWLVDFLDKVKDRRDFVWVETSIRWNKIYLKSEDFEEWDKVFWELIYLIQISAIEEIREAMNRSMDWCFSQEEILRWLDKQVRLFEEDMSSIYKTDD